MSGRKNPKPTESEKEHEYVMAQKRGFGDTVVGEGGEFLDEEGAVGEVRRRREGYREFRDEIPHGKDSRKE